MPFQKEFWESIGVSVDDIFESEVRLGNKVYRRLANKLKKNPDMGHFIIEYFKVRGNSLPEVASNLYSTSIDDFRDVYATSLFADKKINPDIIYEVASKTLVGEIAQRISSKIVNPDALLIPLFKTNSESLKQIYYEQLFQCKSLKPFVCKPQLIRPIKFDACTKVTIEAILKKFEKQAKSPRPVKLWWFDYDSNSSRIVFRRERKARSKLRLVAKNSFVKTAEEKIFVFRLGGNILEICSTRGEKNSLALAEFLVNQLTNQTVQYYEVSNSYKTSNVDIFIQRLIENKIKDVTLTGIRVKNAPLASSPTVELSSRGSSVPAITDLKEKHSLSLVRSSADVVSFKIQFQGRTYNLRSDSQGDKVEISSDNRNIREKDKEKLPAFLNKQIG